MFLSEFDRELLASNILSWGAKGVYIYLKERDEINLDINIIIQEGLSRNSSEVETVNCINELIQYGYLKPSSMRVSLKKPLET